MEVKPLEVKSKWNEKCMEKCQEVAQKMRPS
jgi:hypothetical protein